MDERKLCRVVASAQPQRHTLPRQRSYNNQQQQQQQQSVRARVNKTSREDDGTMADLCL
jgi:hypothetical protein